MGLGNFIFSKTSIPSLPTQNTHSVEFSPIPRAMESLFTGFLPRAWTVSSNRRLLPSNFFGGTRNNEAIIRTPRRRATLPGIHCMAVIAVNMNLPIAPSDFLLMGDWEISFFFFFSWFWTCKVGSFGLIEFISLTLFWIQSKVNFVWFTSEVRWQ